MKYLGFKIENYKGIQTLDLDLSKSPLSSIYTLVGINESGKTTLLEALNYFYRAMKKDDPVLDENIDEDIHKLIPINRRSNFSDSVRIRTKIELDDDDKLLLKRLLKRQHRFIVDEIANNVDIQYKFPFIDSEYGKWVRTWTWKIMGKTVGASKIKNVVVNSSAGNTVRKAIIEGLPSIIYYPNFLFDFPDKLYIEDREANGNSDGKIDIFYRKLIQDILDSLDEDLDLQKHVINRSRDGKARSLDALESVINKMNDKVTDVIFRRGWSVFNEDNSARMMIQFSPPKKDEEGVLYMELIVKDGPDSYRIAERSLGFRWFFTFLIFTQFRMSRKNSPQNTIFLLDEPAYNLHQSAQSRLLRSFEQMTTNYPAYIIYATHSQHLINPGLLESTFVVRNEALKEEEFDSYNAKMTDITVERYRSFVSSHPNQTTYFQPILDLLEYVPSE